MHVMCGILDWYHPRGLDGRADEIASRTDLMTHRGPDGSGYHVSGKIGLGHRRLAIIDLEGGKQPFYSEDDRYALVYNGEIYNHFELREDLESRGYAFRSTCDTEVLVHGDLEWGFAELLDRIDGMFAFAGWDGAARRLMLARDRMGQHPLVHTATTAAALSQRGR